MRLRTPMEAVSARACLTRRAWGGVLDARRAGLPWAALVLPSGQRAIHLAAIEAPLPVLEQMLEMEAPPGDYRVGFRYCSPLRDAMERRRDPVAALLVAAGALRHSPVGRHPSTGPAQEPLLLLACRRVLPATMQALLGHGRRLGFLPGAKQDACLAALAAAQAAAPEDPAVAAALGLLEGCGGRPCSTLLPWRGRADTPSGRVLARLLAKARAGGMGEDAPSAHPPARPARA